MAQKPLDAAGGESPRICIRLAQPKHERLAELAGTSGGTVSALIRELIDRELERADTGPPEKAA
jgi:predicted DNA-binding protein